MQVQQVDIHACVDLILYRLPVNGLVILHCFVLGLVGANVVEDGSSSVGD